MIDITEGAEVAVRGGMDDAHIKFRTIQRLTETLIILDDGTRFQRGGQHYQVGVGRYANRGQVVDPQAPEILNAVARTKLRDLSYAINSVTNGGTATVHRMDADDVLGELAKFQAMAAAARAEIERRMGR